MRPMVRSRITSNPEVDRKRLIGRESDWRFFGTEYPRNLAGHLLFRQATGE